MALRDSQTNNNRKIVISQSNFHPESKVFRPSEFQVRRDNVESIITQRDVRNFDKQPKQIYKRGEKKKVLPPRVLPEFKSPLLTMNVILF